MRALPLTQFLYAHLAKLACIGLFALPVLGLYLPGLAPGAEQRALAGLPPAPASLGAALAWPAALEAGINDRFPMRAALVRLNARLRHGVFGQFPTVQVVAGRNGHTFLASHVAHGVPYGAIRVACGDGFDGVELIVQELNVFERRLHARGLRPRLLIVPSAPVIYNEQLPPWMAARCPASGVPALAVLASPRLSAAARALTYFPLATLRALGPDAPAQPQHYFHWAGAGPRAVAEASEQRFWQRPAGVASALPLESRPGPSDVQSMYPGIEIIRMVGTPQLAGSGITACEGGACFPGLESVMTKLDMVARYTNGAPGLGPRLVILGDSFGPNAVPWFARFHREVVLIGTNNLTLLDAAELARLRSFALRPDSGDELLYLYHDVTVYSGRVLADMENLKL